MLTAGQVEQYMVHTLGSQSIGLSMYALINQAGRHFTTMHGWKFLERPQVELNLRAEISVTTGTWVESTKTFTATLPATAFATYIPTGAAPFLDGDQFRITAGTGAILGLHKIERCPSTTTIVLKNTISSAVTPANLTADDVVGKIDNDTVALPSDFAEVVAYDTTQSLIKSIEMVTLQRLLVLKTQQVPVNRYNFFAAIVWPEMNINTTTGPTETFPVLKLWPNPSVNDAGGITLFYRAGWTDVNEANDYIQLPVWAEAFFIQLCITWARGFKEEDTASLSMRLMEVEASPLYAACIRRDGMIQPDYGTLRGGAVESQSRGENHFLRSTVQGPA